MANKRRSSVSCSIANVHRLACVYDGYSIRLVEAAGFSCASTSGAAISNALLGYPDAGAMGLYENVNHCRHLARSVSIPLTADADTATATDERALRHPAVRGSGRRGGQHRGPGKSQALRPHAGKDVVATGEMVRKIEAACLARKTTHSPSSRAPMRSRSGHRGRRQAREGVREAGADMIFPDAVNSEEDIARIVDAAGIRCRSTWDSVSARVPTTPTDPHFPRSNPSVCARISLPRMLPAASIRAMENALQLMRQSMETAFPSTVPICWRRIEDIMKLMGYDAMRKLEARLVAAPLAAD
jgi:2-methylisocitrate lyase-like PEP mutase family enzyme